MSTQVGVIINKAIVAVCDKATRRWTPPEQITVKLNFDTTNPFAVELTAAGVPWTFDRTLLKAVCAVGASNANFGMGDIQLRRVTSDRIVVFLYSEESACAITMDSKPCVDFIVAVDNAVAPGTEHYDIDAWIAGLRRETA